MTAVARPELVRTIGRLALTGLVLNGIIGSAIYRLPADVAGRMGSAAPLAWLVAALLVGVIIACFAEVASRFREAGGPYLYVTATFGDYAGLQTGWMAYLARLTASATVANVFVDYLREFWPAARNGFGAPLVLGGLVGGLAVVNYRGVGQGSRVSTLLASIKVLALALFVVAGLAWAGTHGRTDAPTPAVALVPWLKTLLILVYAFGGFEAALMPLAEARDPERDAPVALFAGLALCAVLYTLVQLVVTWILPGAEASTRPLADTARVVLGGPGAAFISACALLSSFGYLAGGMVNVPRLTMAMADRGDLPPVFARIHPVFRTPAVSIVAYATLVFAMASTTALLTTLTLSVVARLITYGLVCAALPLLRARDGSPRAAPPAAFRLPGGILFAALGVAGMVAVATQVTSHEAMLLGGVVLLASLQWWVTRRARA